MLGWGGGGGERKIPHCHNRTEITQMTPSLKASDQSHETKSVLAPEEAGSRCMDKIREDHSGSREI